MLPPQATFLSTEYPNGTNGPGVSTQVFPFVTDPGLAVVIQDVRGCGPTYSAAVGCTSPGRGLFDFPNTSATDGYDTVEWITKQPWSNGKVALNGMAIVIANPPAQPSPAPPWDRFLDFWPRKTRRTEWLLLPFHYQDTYPVVSLSR